MKNELKEKKVDRRVNKTKKAIKNALLTLLQTKEIDEITIKAIADEADVDRKTLYTYYSGIDAIIEEFSIEIVQSLDKVLESINYSNYLKNPNIIFDKLNQVINSNIDLYSLILKMKANNQLKEKLYVYLKQKIKDSITDFPLVNSSKRDLVINFVAAGLLSTYQDWFISSRDHSLEEISKDITILVTSGVNGIIQANKK